MSTSPVFQNIYYKRTTATAKPCFVCYRPTTTVLATINTVDFLYTCDGHLKDPGFATRIDSPAEQVEKPKVSEEEIKKAKEEWEEKQRRKEKEKAAADKDKDKDKDAKDKETTSKPKSTPPGPTPMPVITTPKPTHERYILHRSIWAMRLSEHKKKRQTTAAKQVAPRLPIAPRSSPAFPPAPSS